MNFTKTILESVKYWVENKFSNAEREIADKYALKDEIPVTSVNNKTGDVIIDIPTIPSSLPNPSALIIDGKRYDGSEEVDIVTSKVLYVTVTDNGDGTGIMDKTYDELMVANAAGYPIVAMLNASDGASFHGGVLLTVTGDFIIGTVISQIDTKSIVIVAITSDIVMMRIIKLVPDTLPNPNVLVINDKEYDGSEAVSIDTTIYEFNVTINEDGTKVFDETYDGILAAHESGRTVICNYINDTGAWRLPLVMVVDGILGFIAMPMPAMYLGCILTADGNVEVMETQSNITINDQTWDGDAPVDFTNTINSMIDEKVPAKLSELENDLVSGASVGQTVRITAVDEKGVPTAWEAVDIASGSGVSDWELIAEQEIRTEDDVSLIEFDGIEGYDEAMMMVFAPWSSNANVTCITQINGVQVEKDWYLFQTGNLNCINTLHVKKIDPYTYVVEGARSTWSNPDTPIRYGGKENLYVKGVYCDPEKVVGISKIGFSLETPLLTGGYNTPGWVRFYAR